MTALYNEIDAYPAEWLRNLIAAGHIAHGVVDERSITDLRPAELARVVQFHAFAGIGVWSHALRLAGWPDGKPVWTGSCPCQPFSTAGRRGGTADDRHLWPAWFRLIAECRPRVIFGEQVASGDGLAWLDVVCADLESAGYAVGALDLCAASVGAPHKRKRIYFVACAVGDTDEQSTGGHGGALPRTEAHDGRGVRRLADGPGDASRDHRGPVNGFWRDAEWIACRDPVRGTVYRPIEPGLEPLAHGIAARVGRLRAYGNAIVAPQAAEFIRAVMALDH